MIEKESIIAQCIRNGNNAYFSGNYGRAISEYSEAIRRAPQNSAVYNNRGLAYGELKEFGRAIMDYSEAIRLDPQNSAAYNNRGVAYGELKEFGRAIKD